jgi:hypothetical protein
VNKSEQINELALALSKAQGQMLPAKMDAENPFLHNKYADLGSVIQAARKPLSDNGLSFTQHPTIEAGRVSVCTILMHSSGQWVESVIDLPIGEEKGLSLAQSMGKVVTYLRRYSLSAILGIYADEDTDGNESQSQRTNGKPQSQSRPQPAPAVAAQPTNGNGKHAPDEPPPPDGYPMEIIGAVADKYGINATRARNMLQLSNLPTDSTIGAVMVWAEVYKANRDKGMTPQEAATAANG